MKHPLSLRARAFLLIGVLVLLTFAVTIVVLTRQATSLQEQVTLQYAEQLALANAASTIAPVQKAMDAARVVSQTVGG